MIEIISVIVAQSKGFFIGATTGIVHETFIVVRKKSRTAKFINYFLTFFVSGFIGLLSYGYLEESGMRGWFLYVWTVIPSANSFIILQVITNAEFILAVAKSYAPNLKIKIEKDDNLKK